MQAKPGQCLLDTAQPQYNSQVDRTEVDYRTEEADLLVTLCKLPA